MTSTPITTKDFRNMAATYDLLQRIAATPASELPALRAEIAAVPVAKRTGHGGSAMQEGRKRAALAAIDTKAGA